MPIKPFKRQEVQRTNQKYLIMKSSIQLLVCLALILCTTSFTTTSLSIDNWIKLGSKKVSYKLDRDVIKVGTQDGRFTKLKVQVTGGALNMHKMIVEYGNGSKDEISLKHQFKNEGTRVIDLNGNKRVIKDITFFYDTKNKSKRRATVHVFGRR